MTDRPIVDDHGAHLRLSNQDAHFMLTRSQAVVLLFALMFTTFALVGASGCSDGSFSLRSHEARYIGGESLDRIKKGETDRQWVLAVMGKPHKIEQLAAGGGEIWTYQYQPVAGANRAYILNPKSSQSANPRSIYIQFAGATVKDWWQD